MPVVTQHDRLAATINLFLKAWIDDPYIISDSSHIKQQLSKLLTGNVAFVNHILQNKTNSEYKDILLWTFITKEPDLVRTFEIAKNDPNELNQKIDTTSDSLGYNNPDPSDIVLPFSLFRDNKREDFLNIIQRIYGAPLTSEQSDFVLRNFDKYYRSQDPLS